MHRTARRRRDGRHRPGEGGQRRFGDTGDREQPGRAPAQQLRRQQGQRVEIDRAPQQPPVQTARGTVRRTGAEPGHHLPRSHRIPLGDQRLHRLIGDPQRRRTRPGQSDRQHPAARDPARERHPAPGSGPYHRARRGGEIHPAVPPAVRRLRRLPAAQHHRPRPHRPDPAAVAAPIGIGSGDSGGRENERQEERDEEREEERESEDRTHTDTDSDHVPTVPHPAQPR